jgi:hypothetical protein
MFPQTHMEHMNLVGKELVVFPFQIADKHPVQKNGGEDQSA